MTTSSSNGTTTKLNGDYSKLHDATTTHLDHTLGKCLHGHFRSQASKTPDRIALMEQHRTSVTYGELDKASDQLAVMLLKKGLVKDDSVGILMERRMEYALSYVAIHKAGGAYLPLDPAYPQSLLESVLVDSQPRVVLCTQPFVDRLPKDQSYIVLSDDWKDCLQAEISKEDQGMLDSVDDDDLDMLAYIVYSSGTTGKPKGIACPHRGAVFSYLWRHDAIPYKEETTHDGTVQTEIEGCNVFFVWEMMRPLLKGHILCVIPDTVIYDPPSLSKYIEEMKITRMLFTPSLLEAVLDYKTPTLDGGGLTSTNGGGEHSHDLIASRMKTMTTIVLCGEVVTVTLWERCKTRLPWTTIWNLYSVSECHDVAAINLSSGKEDYKGRKYCPVGRLLPGVEAHVMEVIEPEDGASGASAAAEPTLLPKALGEVGELYVAGPTLARGYVGLDELTSKRFPTVNGIRLYKTGDRARVLPNRQLEILGRCDSMVKVRGYSVELRAIESAIMTLVDLVSSCCVIVQGDEGEDKFVIAYVVLQKDNPQATCRNVRLALKAKLVHYMVPAYLVALDELPTHEVSGKLNKKALPPVDVNSPDGGMTSDCTVPRTSLESKLHSIWCDIMNMKQIDVIFDSFFDIGGHSLLAARLVQRISVELPEWTTDQNKEVTVVDLFSHATIAQLATFLSGETIPAAAPNGKDDTTTALMVEELQKLDLQMEVTQYDTSEAVSDQAMRAFWRSTHFKQVKARSVLLTGATGFLGSFLLYELLKGSGSYHVDIVYCLVRATSDAEAAHRLQEKLQSQDMWEDEFALKLQVFAGDASLHQLGLDDDDYAMLSTGVDMIVHCAAMVNLVYPYEGLRSANVVGTSNIIKYALTGRVKKLAYISTDAVFPDGLPKGTICHEEDDLQFYAETLSKTGNGYSQSKWVAEILVRHAQDRGLPALIFRPGNMGGSTKGIWNPSDLNFLVLKGCIALGMVPNIPGWIMEMTPVDFASKAIISICCGGGSSNNGAGSGEPNANLGKTFHVTNFGNCLQANEYFNALQSVGIPLETLSLKEWRDKVLATESIELQKLRNFLLGGAMSSVESMTELAILDNSLFATKCQQMGYEVPHISQSTMKDYFYTWKALGMITLPKRTPVGLPGHPLAGKVVLITGASSGIGAAIATALSSAGARVGIGGRRLDRLKSLASQLMERPGAAMVHPCQVDVTNRQDMERFVNECEQALQGPTDIFVNNAGVMYYGRLEAMREHEWHNELDVNCKGLLHATACILPGMLSRGSGHIVVTSSDAGRKVFAGLANYSATKFFVEAFCQGMRLENADRGLKVTTIQPGDCRTELSKLTTDDEARSEFAQSSQEREYWLDPEDVAQAVLFAVASPYHVGVNEILIEPRGAPI